MKLAHRLSTARQAQLEREERDYLSLYLQSQMDWDAISPLETVCTHNINEDNPSTVPHHRLTRFAPNRCPLRNRCLLQGC